MHALRIQMLGPFRVWRQGELISNEAWPTQKCRQLLKLLLTERGHSLAADRILDALWRDLPPQKAQNNLWVTVSQLRRVLEPGLERRAPSSYIQKDPQGYTFKLDSGVWLDVDEFSAQIQSGRLLTGWAPRLQAFEAARKLYQGGFLEEDLYEDWAASTRRRLQDEYLALLTDLADAHARLGRYRRAIALCREGLAAEHTHEPFYRSLMVYHYSAREYNLALKVFEECRQVLEAELGVVPDETTLALYRQIQRRYVESVDRDAFYPLPEQGSAALNLTAFVGRSQELDQLIEFTDQLILRRGRVVLIEGEPGIGKSRLVQEALAYARQRGSLILTSACYQIEQSTPFQPIVDGVDSLVRSGKLDSLPVRLSQASAATGLARLSLAEIAALVPEVAARFPDLPDLAPGLDEARQARLFRALVQLLETLAGSEGLVWAMDDVHWADYATLKFLHYLARLTPGLPILLLCTYRPEELPENDDLQAFVAGLSREQTTSRLALKRLHLGDVQAIAEALVASPQDAASLSRWLHHETAGNPFFVVTILQSLWEQGLLDGEGAAPGIADLESLPGERHALALPEALRASVRTRLARLPRRSRSVLEMAAVLRRRFEYSTLQAITGESPGDLLEILEDLLARRLLQETGDSRHYDFGHDKIREVVYHELSAARRAYLHRSIAQTLESLLAGSDEIAGTLAEHYEQGQVWSKAVAYLAQAAARSRRLFALREALHFYERLLHLADEHPEAAGSAILLDLYEQRGETLTQAGEFARAITDLEAALQRADQAHDLTRQRELRISLGQVYRRADDYQNACRHLNHALEDARSNHDLQRIAHTLFHLGDVVWTEGNNRQARLYQQEAVEICRLLGSQDLIAIQACHGLAETYFMDGELAPAEAYLEESLALARRQGDKAYEAENLYMLGATYAVLQGSQYERAQTLLHESLAISQAASMDWHEMPPQFILSQALRGLGSYAQAFAHAARAVHLGERLHTPYFLTIALDFQGVLFQDLGELAQAEAIHARGVEVALKARCGNWLPRLQANLAIDRLRLGKLHSGDVLQFVLHECDERQQGLHATRCLEGLAELALAQGDPQSAAGWAEQLLERSLPRQGGEVEVQAHRWRGLARLAQGNLGAARSDLAAAFRLGSAIGRPGLLVELHAALQELSAAEGDASAAAAHARSLAEIMARIKASAGAPRASSVQPE